MSRSYKKSKKDKNRNRKYKCRVSKIKLKEDKLTSILETKNSTKLDNKLQDICNLSLVKASHVNGEGENIDVRNELTKINQIDLKKDCNKILPDNFIFIELLGKEIIVIMSADQLNILGQTFRPVFCGTLDRVTNGFITLNPVIIKMSNAPFYRFPTPLSFPIINITHFFPFDCNVNFPLT